MSKTLKPELEYDLERFLRGEQPTHSELNAAPRLKKWHVVVSREYDSRDSLSLRGIIKGHQYIADGDTATTSELLWLDPGRAWARTHTQIYVLEDEDTEAYLKGGG